MAFEIQSPFPLFCGKDGKPLENGSVYIGEQLKNPITDPIAVFWDEAGSQPAAQPLKVSGGYIMRSGTPARVYVNADDYSLSLYDKKGGLVFYVDSVVSVLNFRQELAASSGSSQVGHVASGAGAVATTAQEKARETKSLFDYMTQAQKDLVRARTGYDATKRADMLTAITAAWNAALAGQFDLYAPAGLYEIGEAHFPWRNTDNTSLLDAKNITLYCEGPGTEFKTVSVNGADVFQMNAIKNFHVRGFPTLSATISGSSAGSNGVSITNGWDNLTLEVTCLNLPSLDKTTFVDGGKALTLQPASTANECGTLKAVVHAKGCAEGFGLEVALSTAATKDSAIDVELIAEDCFFAAKVVGAEATAALSSGMTLGLKVRGLSINCQKDVVLNRAHGVDVDVKVITTKTEAARRLSPSGVAWFAADAIVEAFHCAYAKDSRIVVTGNKGACAYKARIGGTTAGASGLNGRTEHCDIYLDIGGTASVANVLEIDSGGNTLGASVLRVTSTTATSLPTAYYVTALQNELTFGQARRLVDPTVAGQLTLAQGANGSTTTGAVILKDSQITGLQGKATGGAGTVIAGLFDNAGTLRLGILNGNGIVIDAMTSSSALGAYIGKTAVYNAAGTFIGYFPLYN